MNPAVVIPTYWSTTDHLGEPGSVACYDHATPIDAASPELDACIASLEQVAGLGTVIILVAADPSVEARAVKRVDEICRAHNLANVVIVDSFKAAGVLRLFEGQMPPDIGEAIGLVGYGAIRNMGLLTCCVLGCDVAVFLDDDEVVLNPDFLTAAIYGLGAQPRSGAPIMAKTGYFLDRRNSALADRRHVRKCDKHWDRDADFNEWMTQALSGPRISRSNTLCGGCFAVHAEAFTRVAFDPWITRGEDLDYLFDLTLYGIDVWFDNKWRVRHNPPVIAGTANRFLQDVYRWLYECRKIEVANTNIDLRKIIPDQFMPYPGTYIGPELPKRILKTALLRGTLTKEHLAYLKIRSKGFKEAQAYAEMNCNNYLGFMTYWNTIAATAWASEPMKRILCGPGMLDPAIAAHVSASYGMEQQPMGEAPMQPMQPMSEPVAYQQPMGEPPMQQQMPAQGAYQPAPQAYQAAPAVPQPAAYQQQAAPQQGAYQQAAPKQGGALPQFLQGQQAYQPQQFPQE